MDKIESLRQQISKLREERDKITFQKGLMAKDNKDLRENSSYDFYEQKERNISGRILNLIKEIEDLTKKH